MLPIHIFQGQDRFILVRAGTAAARGGEMLTPARARTLLEQALHRRDPRLIRELAAALNMPGADADVIAARGIERLVALEGEFVMIQAPRAQGERRREVSKPEADLPPPEPVAEEEQEEEEPPRERVKIRVSLFFDGTANNRANTRRREAFDRMNKKVNEEREAAGKDKKKYKTWMAGSYENSESNVSRLETLYKQDGDANFDHSFSIYVEGIGTNNAGRDNAEGLALGTGGTGVPAKVTRGLNELIDGIRGLGIPKDVIIEKLDVDTFGFSRGAAAARHAVQVAVTKNPLDARVEKLGYTVEAFEMHFVGLYDTVASYGVVHKNDTADLGLDSITNAKRVVQIAAAEEHRKNFRLTNIVSVATKTGQTGQGTELYFPGVHSDIGGGYVDGAGEDSLQILDLDGFSTKKMRARFAKEVAWLERSGWYIGKQIEGVNWANELRASKASISAAYNRIPLKHMAKFASDTGIVFDPPSETKWPIIADLATIDGIIDAHVAAHISGAKPSTAKRWLTDETEPMRQLRNKYLHFSAYYGNVANGPQWSEGGKWKGERERIVQDG